MKYICFGRQSHLMLVGLLILLLSAPFVVIEDVLARETSPIQPSSPPQRVIRTGTPKHVPLKIVFKNINNEKWAHDLEIEVTNQSDKPIYYLSFNVHPQYVAIGIEQFAFWVHYGRPQLNNFSTPLEKTDVPLLPDETCVLKINEPDANGWERFRIKHNLADTDKVGVVFQALNFGDGTGFMDAHGTPVKKKK